MARSAKVRKDAGKLAEVDAQRQLSAMRGTVGIAHTRWAAHGGVYQANAHPHVSADGCFAIVHNGVIKLPGLESRLTGAGIYVPNRKPIRKSSSLSPPTISRDQRRSSSRGGDQATARGLCVCLCSRRTPEVVVPAWRALSSSVSASGTCYLASMSMPLPAIPVRPYSCMTVSMLCYAPPTLLSSLCATTTALPRLPVSVAWSNGRRRGQRSIPLYAERNPCRCWLCQRRSGHSQDYDRHARATARGQWPLFFTGLGTPICRLARRRIFLRDPGRLLMCQCFSADESPLLAQVAPGALTLAVSQSGETYDTLKALRYARTRGSATAAIVNAPGSSMTREVDQVVLQGAGAEICVLSTKSTISQVTIFSPPGVGTAPTARPPGRGPLPRARAGTERTAGDAPPDV